MPVSRKEETGVLSRKSSTDIYAGIPLKKRRFLLVPPSSPPRQEALPEVNDLKKHEESSSDTRRKEKLGTDSMENEESSLELKKKETSCAHKEESGVTQGSNNDSGSDFGSKQECVSSLQKNLAYGPDLKNNEMSTLNQGPCGIDVTGRSPGKTDACKVNLLEVKEEIVSTPNAKLDCLNAEVSGVKPPELSPMVDLGSANGVESKTDILTGERASSGVPGMPPDTALLSVKKEIHSKLVEEDLKLKLLGLGTNGKSGLGSQEFLIPSVNIDPSLFSLSLSKEKHVTEEKSGGISLNTDSKSECANRSNWDLNTTMDAWEGSICDAAFQGTTGESGKTISSSGRRLLSSNSTVNVSSQKEKQAFATNEPRSSSPDSSVQLTGQSEDSLRLTLSSSFAEMDFARKSPDLSAEVALREECAKVHSGLLPTEDKKSPDVKMVKSEPSHENSNAELSDCTALKKECVEKLNVEAVKVSAGSTQDITGQNSFKSEPINEVSREFCTATDLRLQQLNPEFVHLQESGSCSSSSVLPLPSTARKPSPSRLPATSELSTSANVTSQSEQSTHFKEPHMGINGFLQAATDMIPEAANHRTSEGNMADLKMDNSEAEDMKVDHPELERTKDRMHGEGSVSDEEKVNISAEIMEEESSGSEYESDCNLVFGSHLQGRSLRDDDDDDYEDGEVRDPLENSKREEHTADGGTDTVKHVDCGNQHFPSGFPTNTDQSCLFDKEKELNIHCDDTAVDCIKESDGTFSNKICEQLVSKDVHSDKLPSDGMAPTGAYEELCSSSERKLLGRTGKNFCQESVLKDVSCDATTSPGIRTGPTVGEARGEIAKAVNMSETLLKVETSLNGSCAAKDSTSGINKSRIINLPRASGTSPKMRPIADEFLWSRNVRGSYSDFDEEKFIPRGKRDEMDYDGRRRFIRERNHDQSFRNSRSNYTRGRGRFSGRLDTSRREWGSNRDFAFGRYNNDYRFTRNKHATAKLEGSDDCVIPPDGASPSSARGWKSWNDDLGSFRHPSSRRFSPGGRDGTGNREIHMIRRNPRNISPGRLNNDNGFDLVGFRQDEKYARDLPDGITEPAYTRSNLYEERNTHLVRRGNGNFGAFRRRGFHRVRSRSPVGSRLRSPGPWSSPRRRSPDRFLLQWPQRRSPGMYRVERMRSPDRSCFHEDTGARRRGSPSFLARPSDDVRDVDSGREHGHPRPMNPSRRSPSDRFFARSTRRNDALEPQSRTGDDEYFGRAVSGRSQDFHGEESSEERRKSGESRELIRSFRDKA